MAIIWISAALLEVLEDRTRWRKNVINSRIAERTEGSADVRNHAEQRDVENILNAHSEGSDDDIYAGTQVVKRSLLGCAGGQKRQKVNTRQCKTAQNHNMISENLSCNENINQLSKPAESRIRVLKTLKRISGATKMLC